MILTPKALGNVALCYTAWTLLGLVLLALVLGTYDLRANDSPPIRYDERQERYEPVYPTIVRASQHIHPVHLRQP